MSRKIFPLPTPPSDGELRWTPAAHVPGDVEKAEARSAIKPAAVSMDKRKNGDVIIQPPPGIRAIIDVTAGLAAKNGAWYEKRMVHANVLGGRRRFDFFLKLLFIKKKEGKFDFLMLSDPYNAYYHHKVAELRDQLSFRERFSV